MCRLCCVGEVAISYFEDAIEGALKCAEAVSVEDSALVVGSGGDEVLVVSEAKDMGDITAKFAGPEVTGTEVVHMGHLEGVMTEEVEAICSVVESKAVDGSLWMWIPLGKEAASPARQKSQNQEQGGKKVVAVFHTVASLDVKLCVQNSDCQKGRGIR